jgi:hypothetical protein
MNLLRQGKLHEDLPDDSPDYRNNYPIRGLIPRALHAQLLALKSSARAKYGASEALPPALLRILEHDELDFGAAHYREERKSLLASGEWMAFEFEMWLTLPNEPRNVLHATDAEFAGLPPADQVALATTLLLGVHDCELPALARRPRTGDRAFDIGVLCAGNMEDGERLEGMFRLVEAALRQCQAGGRDSTRADTEHPELRSQGWRPPLGYIAASEILHEGKPVPASTVAGWRARYGCDHKTHPATGEYYYPIQWIQERLRTYVRGRNLPAQDRSSALN